MKEEPVWRGQRVPDGRGPRRASRSMRCRAAAPGPMPVRSAARPLMRHGGERRPDKARRARRGAPCGEPLDGPRRAVPLRQDRCRWRARPRGPRYRPAPSQRHLLNHPGVRTAPGARFAAEAPPGQGAWGCPACPARPPWWRRLWRLSRGRACRGPAGSLASPTAGRHSEAIAPCTVE
jgi:hypothetical protein